MMFNFVILFVPMFFFTGVYTQAINGSFPDIKVKAEECFIETNVTKQIVMAVIKDGESTNNQKVKDFNCCLFNKTNVIDQNNNINDNKLSTLITPFLQKKENAKDIIDICLKETDTICCERAFKITKCIAKNYIK